MKRNNCYEILSERLVLKLYTLEGTETRQSYFRAIS